MRNPPENQSFGKICGISVLFGIGVGGVLCMLFLLLMAAVITGLDIPRSAVMPLALVAGCGGALFGGGVAGWIGRMRGWLCGLLTGLSLFVIVWVVGSALSLETEWTHQLLKAVLFAACGLVGGAVGVNLRHR